MRRQDYQVRSEMDVDAVNIYQAGQWVRAGIYLSLEGGREVHLEQEDAPPAPFNSHGAVYLRRPESGRERQAQWE